MRRASLMVYPLVIDVVDYFRKGSFAKTDDSISLLPLQRLWLHSMVDVPRTSPLQIANPIANQKGWRNPHSQMDVVLNASHSMNFYARTF
jgi:hypothetical protein